MHRIGLALSGGGFRATLFHQDGPARVLAQLPEGKLYQGNELMRYPADSPESVDPANEMISPDGRIVAFSLLSLEPGYMYERLWTYRD